MSTDYTTSRPAIGTDRARATAFDHALFFGGRVSGTGGRWQAKIRAEFDKDQIFFPADRTIANVPLAHQADTGRYVPQDFEVASLQQGSASALSTNRAQAAEVVVGLTGHWSFLFLHGDVSKLAFAEVCSGGIIIQAYCCDKRTGPSAQNRLVIKRTIQIVCSLRS